MILDRVSATVTGWSRDNARRRLDATAGNVGSIDGRKQRGMRYQAPVPAGAGSDLGGQGGKFLGVCLPLLLRGAHG